MNLPTHMVAGALIGQTVLWGWRARAKPVASPVTGAALLIVAFGLAAIGHVWMDRLPHNNWVLTQRLVTPFLPRTGHLVQAVLAGLLLLPVLLCCARNQRIFLLISALGGLYPDIEKVGYFYFDTPRWLLVFKNHSTIISTNTGGWPLALLGWTEALATLMMLAAIWRMNLRLENQGACRSEGASEA